MAVPVRLTDNRVVLADDNYFRDTIREPNAKFVSRLPVHHAHVPRRGGAKTKLHCITESHQHLGPQGNQPAEQSLTPTQIRDSEGPNLQEQKQAAAAPAHQPRRELGLRIHL